MKIEQFNSGYKNEVDRNKAKVAGTISVEHFESFQDTSTAEELTEFFNNPEETPEVILNKLREMSQSEENITELLNILNIIGETLSSFKLIDTTKVDELIVLLEKITSEEDTQTLAKDLRTYLQ